MIGNDTDKEWEKFGKENPYFGVLSDEAFKTGNLDSAARERFFASGREYVDEVFRSLAGLAGPEFRPRTALDFGCGVGRLTIPLAARCGKAVGVDVSPSMLAEARANCDRMGVTNAAFRASVAEAKADGPYDLINSFIVFQHIPPARGYALFADLLGQLAPGGAGALQVTFAIRASRFKRAAGWLRRRFQPFNMLVNLSKGLPPGAPFMQMNAYDLNLLMRMIGNLGCRDIRISLTEHQGHAGALLLFRKPAAGA